MSRGRDQQQYRMNHVRIGWILFKRDLMAGLLSPAVYVAVTVACLISTFFVVNYLTTLNKMFVLVAVDPLSTPLFFAIALMALYIGVLSSISIAGEREHHTLEVLFYGPVTPWTLVVAKFSYGIAIFLVAQVFFMVYLLFQSTFTHLVLGMHTLKTIGVSFFLVWPMVSFSLLLSVAFNRVRYAILVFIGLFLALMGLQVVYGLLSGIPPESISLFFLYLREGLAILLKGLQWVSPFFYIARATTDIPLGFPMSVAWSILVACLYSSLLLIAAIVVLKKKGAICG